MHVALVALYLPGLPRVVDPPRGRWRLVNNALRTGAGSNPEAHLRLAGMWLEAGVLAEVGLWEAACAVCDSGRAVTPACPSYPPRWRQFSWTPPALWLVGEPPSFDAPTMAIVGSRALSSPAARFARDAGHAVGMAGAVLVSGGAFGADREAGRGVVRWAAEAGVPTPFVQIVPFGIGRLDRRALGWERGPAGCVLSLAAPQEGFSAALAMERNALIYAAAERSLVVAARLREGGTWVGATAALRRKTTCLFVREDGSAASSALRALGASPIQHASEFPTAEARMGQFPLVR